FAGWVSRNQKAVEGWVKWLAIGAAGIIALRVAVVAFKAVVEAATIVQNGFNLAMSANPIALVVKGLVVLAAGVVYAYEKFQTFRNIVNTVAADAIRGVQFMVTTILRYYADLISAAAKAADFLGMHGLAKDLNTASQNVQNWANDVNKALGGIVTDLTVTVHMMTVTDSTRAGMQSVYNSQVPKFTETAKKAGVSAGKAFSSGVGSGIASGAPKAAKAAKSAAQTLADQLKAAMASAAQSIASSLSGSITLASSMTGGSYTDIYWKNGKITTSQQSLDSGSSIAARFAAQVAAMKVFAGQITRLRKMGLNGTMLGEITGMGVTKGGALAQDLLSSSSSIKSLNSSQSTLVSTAAGIGQTDASAVYEPQILAALKELVKLATHAPAQHAAALNHVAKASVHRAATVTGR
ncbi:MAG TPA: hypothetical protein VMV41_05755, partial [Cellulomonadaceae bacterium]|nr:hypothetical protein [Cellulomonadaceae bacterium]